MENQPEGSNPLFDKARRFIRSANLLTEEGDYDSAVSRLYYAMLFTAQALLETQGLSFSSHRATISAYGQYFSKTSALDPVFHKALLNAFSLRQLGDYAIRSGLRQEDAESLLETAESFLDAAQLWIVEGR